MHGSGRYGPVQQAYRDEGGGTTRIIGRTASAPGLPYATRIGAGVELVARLRAGLSRAFADPDLGHVRDALLIDGLEVLDPTVYDCMAELEAAAKRQRYLELD